MSEIKMIIKKGLNLINELDTYFNKLLVEIEEEEEYHKALDEERMFEQCEEKIYYEVAKPINKKKSKDGRFDICGIYGKDLKKCSCFYCMGYCGKITDLSNDWLATKLSVCMKDKDIAKELGARWSPDVKKWYVRANNPNYQDLVNRF